MFALNVPVIREHPSLYSTVYPTDNVLICLTVDDNGCNKFVICKSAFHTLETYHIISKKHDSVFLHTRQQFPREGLMQKNVYRTVILVAEFSIRDLRSLKVLIFHSADIDECSTQSIYSPLCPNGGTCVNAWGGYTCCPSGYTGPHCDQGKSNIVLQCPQLNIVRH